MTSLCAGCGQSLRPGQPICANCGAPVPTSPRSGAEDSPQRGDSPRGKSLRRDKERDRELVGQLVAGKYRVLEVLGQGGFGSVFLVEMVGGILGDRLAMKILPHEFGSEPTLREQFLNEIRVAMRMVNECIVQIRDVGVTDDDILYYTMDYVDGRSLAQVLREEGRLEPRRTLRLVQGVLEALQTAHAADVIHRDLKPANIMVLDEHDVEKARVLDFGIATAIGGEEGQRKGFAGSPFYMPPEQFLGTELYFYTDLYSVGVILYECLTGQKPFRGSTPQEVYNRLKGGPPAPVTELCPEAASVAGLADLVTQAIERNPERRFQSAREFSEAIEDVLSGKAAASRESAPARRATVPGSTPRAAARMRRRASLASRRRRSPAPAIVAATVILALIAAAVIFGPELLDRSSSRGGPRAGGGTPALPGRTEPTASPPPASGRAGSPPSSTARGGDPGSGSQGPETTVASPGRGEEPSGPASGETSPAARREQIARRLDVHLGRCEQLARDAQWPAALDLANEILGVRPREARALAICAEAYARLGSHPQAVGTLEALVKAHGAEALDERLTLLLAQEYSKLSPPRVSESENLLAKARKRFAKSPEIAARLGALYRAQGLDSTLLALVTEAHEQGLSHPLLDELYQTLVIDVRRAREEKARKLRASALEALARRDWSAAIEAARSLDPEDSFPCGDDIIVEAATRSGRLEEARPALARLEKGLEGGPPAGEPCLPELAADRLPHRVAFLRGRELLLEAEAGAEGIDLNAVSARLLETARGAVEAGDADLAVLALTYRAAIIAREAEDLAPIKQALRAASDTRSEEAIRRQARIYYEFGMGVPTEDVSRTALIDRRIGELDRRIDRLSRDYKAARSNKTRAEIKKQAEATAKERAGLASRRAELSRLQSLQAEAFELAIKKMNLLLLADGTPADVLREGYWLLGMAYLRMGEVSGSDADLKKANNRFRRAREAGLDTAELYVKWAESYYRRDLFMQAAVYYKSAYEKAPTADLCLRAAKCFELATRRTQALEILQDGKKRFADDEAIAKKLAELQR